MIICIIWAFIPDNASCYRFSEQALRSPVVAIESDVKRLKLPQFYQSNIAEEPKLLERRQNFNPNLAPPCQRNSENSSHQLETPARTVDSFRTAKEQMVCD